MSHTLQRAIMVASFIEFYSLASNTCTGKYGPRYRAIIRGEKHEIRSVCGKLEGGCHEDYILSIPDRALHL